MMYDVLDLMMEKEWISDYETAINHGINQYGEEFFKENDLICIPYQGSSSIRGKKLFTLDMIETEKVIQFIFHKQAIPEFMDLRKFTIVIPVLKREQKKEIVYSF